MSVANSKDAIAAVTRLLLTTLQENTGIPVDLGSPVPAAQNGQTGQTAANVGKRFNLFLYRIGFDSRLHGTPLDEGQTTPLWTVLHYLLTAHDDNNVLQEQQLLGTALSALHSIDFLKASQNDLALVNNPEALKLMFTETDIATLTKLMPADAFRLSATFQIRPVMIMPAGKPKNEPFQSAGGEELILHKTIGPNIWRLQPANLECGQTITVLGDDIGDAEWILFGSQQLAISHSSPNQVSAILPDLPTIVPGSYPVSVARMMPNQKLRVSNALLGSLLPSIHDVSGDKSTGKILIHGQLLGSPADDVFFALCQHGATLFALDVVGSNDQTQLLIQLPPDITLPDGSYQVIVRVNGAQAPQSPLMDWA